jgi:hypothetical protein
VSTKQQREPRVNFIKEKLKYITIHKRIKEWNLIGMRSTGRPKNRWKDEVLNDLKTLKVKNWTYLVKDRKVWCELVQKTETHKGF